MLVGDPTIRNQRAMQKQICHRCEHNIEQSPFGGAPCTGEDTAAFPTKFCPGGIRTTITFPTFVISLPRGREHTDTGDTAAGTERTSTPPTTRAMLRTRAPAASSPQAPVPPAIPSASRN